MPSIRTMALAAVMIAGFSFAGHPARAFEGPWCAIQSLGSGVVYEDCQYPSLSACRPHVIAGNRGFCNLNPRWGTRWAEPYGPSRPYRHQGRY
ncbi:MAG TPA: DUF3551 domain-containing protein [Pseudolabrys sp.]|nr:DUF3551 domain-containing protein [Pseudolabrys sp.]